MYMLGGGHFGGDEHAGLFLYSLEPGQALGAYALETARLGAWLPDAGAEDAGAVLGQLVCCAHDLLFGLGTAGACDDGGALVVNACECEGVQF